MASNNKYRTGDFVYFETNPALPYHVRRIDELIKTPNGVEAKVTCYFRRRDISNNLIQQAEKYYFQESDEANGETGQALTDLQKHQIKHRELFHSRTMETLPATHIRGKCTVTLYSEAEPLTSYVERDDTFFYRLIYDPSSKRLQEDRGSMRIGADFQSDIQPLLGAEEEDPRFKQKLEEKQWDPQNTPSDEEMTSIVRMVQAVGLYGRACDPASSQQNPLVINAAAASCRDVTLQFAHDILFKADKDVKRALLSLLLPQGQPVVCKDELETWSSEEVRIFEEALSKYSKVFPDILTDYLPWKSAKSIVEMYYFWKTTDRYTAHRRSKMLAKEQKLKQVYIPDYSKPNASVLYNRTDGCERGCEHCHAETSPQWYAWGPAPFMCRLCSNCWTYWKKYGGLKNPDKRGAIVNSRPSPEQRVQDRLEAARRLGAAKSSTSSNSSATSFSTSNTSNGGGGATAGVGDCSAEGIGHQKAPSHHPHSDAALSSSVYRCSQPGCAKEFRSRDNLAMHLTKVHGINVLPADAAAAAVSGNAVVASLTASSTSAATAAAGTSGVMTSVSLRIARTLCPLLLRPALLARRPTLPANATAQQRPPHEPLIPTDDLLLRLKTLAKSRIPALRDPLAVLNRKLQTRPLKVVVRKLRQRLGLPEEPSASCAALKRPLEGLYSSTPSNGTPTTTNGGGNIAAPPEKRARKDPAPEQQPAAASEPTNGH